MFIHLTSLISSSHDDLQHDTQDAVLSTLDNVGQATWGNVLKTQRSSIVQKVSPLSHTFPA